VAQLEVESTILAAKKLLPGLTISCKLVSGLSKQGTAYGYIRADILHNTSTTYSRTKVASVFMSLLSGSPGWRAGAKQM